MAAIRRIPFIGPSFEAECENANNQRTINFYIVPNGPEAKAPATLKATGGSELISTEGITGPMISYGQKFASVYTINANPLLLGIKVFSGTVLTNTITNFGISEVNISPDVSYPGSELAQNKTQVVLVGGRINPAPSQGYIFGYYKEDESNTFAVETPSNIRPSTIAYHDGYFVINHLALLAAERDSQGFIYVSELEDATQTWPLVSFARMYSVRGNCERIISCGGLLYLLAQDGYEIWYSTGNVDFPFAPIKEASMSIGLAHKTFATSDGNVIFFVGKTLGGLGVYRLDKTQLTKVSNSYIDRILTSCVSSTFTRGWETYGAYLYNDKGHTFLVLNITSTNSSIFASGQLVYDLSTELWHERRVQFYDPTLEETFDTFPYTYGFTTPARTYVVPKNATVTANINPPLTAYNSQLFTEVYTTSYITNFANNVVSRERISQHISGEDAAVFHHRVRLDVDDTNANITLYSSDDDGKTWYSYGTKETTNRTEWFRLGTSEDRIYKITSDSNADIRLTGAYAEVSKGYY